MRERTVVFTECFFEPWGRTCRLVDLSRTPCELSGRGTHRPRGELGKGRRRLTLGSFSIELGGILP